MPILFSRSAESQDQDTLRIIVGAGEDSYEGWIATDRKALNLLREADWALHFKPNTVNAILAEHVWEHLDFRAAITAAQNCFKYLKPGGYMRVAVPDGLHPDHDYIDRVKPGGWGVVSDDHHVLYTYRTLKTVFSLVGFKILLLKYFDERGMFHYLDWSPTDGMIRRSKRFDGRNCTPLIFWMLESQSQVEHLAILCTVVEESVACSHRHCHGSSTPGNELWNA